MSENPKVKDIIDILMASQSGEPMRIEYQEFIDKVQELYGLNSHKAYEKFYTTFLKDKQAGWMVVFEGERDEDVGLSGHL